MPFLLLDNFLPISVGVDLYGFNKRLASISSQGANFEVNGDLGEIRATFTPKGLPGLIGRFPEIEDGRRFLNYPLISQLQTGAGSQLNPHYQLDSATFQALDGEISIRKPFLASPDGRDVLSSQPTPDLAPAPWFLMSTHWRISVPLSLGADFGRESAATDEGPHGRTPAWAPGCALRWRAALIGTGHLKDGKGGLLVTLDRHFIDRLAAMRGLGSLAAAKAPRAACLVCLCPKPADHNHGGCD